MKRERKQSSCEKRDPYPFRERLVEGGEGSRSVVSGESNDIKQEKKLDVCRDMKKKTTRRDQMMRIGEKKKFTRTA